ncbi:hypothetical protein K1T71_001106 [Dendrolimus kikuchii]|uniref:Uncharacterized protein n=1 Tax=Dendrolimus kikuchii TaxID=765133 RepID=A0ACC1DH39_9NEOP|nr:hypothetical protein K1T71_001106 [Dendrolimus kikuchii]
MSHEYCVHKTERSFSARPASCSILRLVGKSDVPTNIHRLTTNNCQPNEGQIHRTNILSVPSMTNAFS